MAFVPNHDLARLGDSGANTWHDSGPVVAGVGGRSVGYDAVEWAAAEATARGVALQIVHAYSRPWTFDPYPAASQWSLSIEWAERVLQAARQRAIEVAPTVPITTHAVPSRAAAAIILQAQDASLIVLGRASSRRRWRPSLAEQVARRTATPLAIVGLVPSGIDTPYSGLVVLSLQGPGPHAAAIASGFKAAYRRGTPLVVMHSHLLRDDSDLPAETWNSLVWWDARYPDVLVELGPADLSRTVGAALLIVSGVSATRRRRNSSHETARCTIGEILRAHHLGPVLFVSS